MEEWHPGSFTKNFSWGSSDRGLKELFDVIRVGFDNTLSDIPRSEFRRRVIASGRPDYIPLNFFLFNRIKSGVDFVVVDELVFQALMFRHSSSFDKLALFAFNISMVGRWKRASSYQERPALWAYHYLSDRVGAGLSWNTKNISADDIQIYISSDERYKAKTSRKLSTNLNYLYKQGKISEFNTVKAERWWLSALFLALDRQTGMMIARGEVPQDKKIEEYIIKSGFPYISGPRSLEKDLAQHHYSSLYVACGGMSRFSDEAVRERQKVLLPEILHFANNPEPIGVVHPTNPNARNAIPRACAVLAHYLAGFDYFDVDELDNFDVDLYVRDRMKRALENLAERGIASRLTAEDILALTRDG